MGVIVEKGKAFFEISRSEFKKTKRWFPLIIIVLIALPICGCGVAFGVAFGLFGFSTDLSDPAFWMFYLIYSLVVSIAVLLSYLKINQFGIYERGLSPPSKPMRMLHKKEVFIPYNDIVNTEVDSKIYTCYITLKNGKEIGFNLSRWVAYLETERLTKVWRILEFVREELLKEENKIKMKNNLPIILDTSKYK